MGHSPTATESWYETPLFYDIVFDGDTVREVDFLENLCARYGRPRGNGVAVLEPACGSGRLVREFASRGWIVHGFDQEEEMLAFARKRVVSAGIKPVLWQDRLEFFRLPDSTRFDLAHCLVSTFKYIEEEAGAVSCLRRISRSLKPGGIFVLGLHLTDYGNERCHHERWVEERAGYQVVCNTRTWPADRRQRRESLRTRLRVRHPDGHVSRMETPWQFRTYSARQLKGLLRQVTALEIVACFDFHYDLERERKFDDSYEDIVVVLRKRN